MIAERAAELDDLPVFENQILLAVIRVRLFAGTEEPLRDNMRERVFC